MKKGWLTLEGINTIIEHVGYHDGEIMRAMTVSVSTEAINCQQLSVHYYNVQVSRDLN